MNYQYYQKNMFKKKSHSFKLNDSIKKKLLYRMYLEVDKYNEKINTQNILHVSDLTQEQKKQVQYLLKNRYYSKNRINKYLSKSFEVDP